MSIKNKLNQFGPEVDTSDTSYCNVRASPIGKYRFTAYSNGNYPIDIPIEDFSGQIIGHCDLRLSLYLWNCVYSDAAEAFFLVATSRSYSHVGNGGAVMKIVRDGSYWFSGKGKKFKVQSSTSISERLAMKVDIFKLINNGTSLLIAGINGFLIINLLTNEVIESHYFDDENWSAAGLTISPHLDTFAFAFSDSKISSKGYEEVSIKVFNTQGSCIKNYKDKSPNDTLFQLRYSADSCNLLVLGNSYEKGFRI